MEKGIEGIVILIIYLILLWIGAGIYLYYYTIESTKTVISEWIVVCSSIGFLIFWYVKKYKKLK